MIKFIKISKDRWINLEHVIEMSVGDPEKPRTENDINRIFFSTVDGDCYDIKFKTHQEAVEALNEIVEKKK